jgi:peptidoglycan/LPS O-acetylase OafA/YrhL
MQPKSSLISIPARAERPPNQDNKLLGIELLRFLSSVAVLIFHYQHFAFVGTVETHFVASQQPFFSLFRLFYNYGFYGVEVFWCISGFIFFWKYSSVIANGTMTGYVFFVLRLSRLYPLHFVTLVFMALMQYVYFSQHSTYFVYPYNDLYHFLLQLGFASNWGVQRGDSFNGPIWSISIEVLVYALFFISLKYASKRIIFIGAVALAAALIQVFKVSEHPLRIGISNARPVQGCPQHNLRVTSLMLRPSLGAAWLAWQIGPPVGFGAEPLAVAGPPNQRAAPPAWRPRRRSLELRTSRPLPARSPVYEIGTHP